MPLPSVSFVLGVFALVYISTFVIFAILRVVTGISIQRLGYLGIRRITFSPRNGIKISIRGIGLTPHRPTFALPTWCSLVITEACLTVDLKAVSEAKKKDAAPHKQAPGQSTVVVGAEDGQEESAGVWERLSKAKEQLKSMHSKIQWLRLVDLVVTDAEVNIIGIGSISVERASLSVDTRSQTVDRSRLFQHYKAKPESQSPAEWKSVVRSVLFTPEGQESTEVLDYCTFNVHGFLHRNVEGLRDASIALKLGRFNVPYDAIETARRNADAITHTQANSQTDQRDELPKLVLSNSNEEDAEPRLHEERLVRGLAQSRKFAASLLGNIQEVQLAVGFFGLSRKLPIKGLRNRDVYFNIAMKEVGLDVLRLDSQSPAHKMYFSPGEVAHQGLLTAIAISAGIDDGHEHPERMLYIPMITATVRTTLPSRTMRYVESDYAGDKNTNLLYANVVCTSPSIDLDPKHLPLMLDLLEKRSGVSKPATQQDRSRLISRILPKASVKLSIQEPVVRVSLPPRDPVASGGNFDLLISTVSSMSLGLESSHSKDGRPHYSLGADYRHVAHQLYYLTAAGKRHDLLQSDTVEVKLEVNAIPDLSVTLSGRLQTFVIYMNRPEISEGVRQIVKSLRKHVLKKRTRTLGPKSSFLRRIPSWLKQFHLEGHDFGIQIAGVNSLVSEDARGLMLELESWSTDYTDHRQEHTSTLNRRRSMTNTSTVQDDQARLRIPDKPRSRRQGVSDGRRLTVHLQNLEGLIVESIESTPADPFMSLPQFEVAFSTSTDSHGPLFHVNSFTKTILLRYSLYYHFSIGVAIMVIKRTFLDEDEKESQSPVATTPPSTPSHTNLNVSGPPLTIEEVAALEITTIDVKANLIQVKASLPSDPPMMLQVYGLDAGRHRWATPFVRSKLARLYVRAPTTKSAWSRIVSMKTLRLDIRDLKRRAAKSEGAADKSFDLTAETIRIGVPHSLIVHNIFDNVTNIIKTSKQMNHHFTTGTDEYILVKEPEGPKHLPRISIRTQIFIFEIEDSSFEWKLGAIYRAGLAEQKQRAARDDLFTAKERRVSRATSRGTPQTRAQSAHSEHRARPRNRHRDADRRTSRSAQPAERKTSDRHDARYETEGKCGLSDGSKVTIAQAREKLQRLNAETWRCRIDRVIEFQKMAIRDIRRSFWGMDHVSEEDEQHEPIMALSQRPGLMAICMSDLSVTIDKPSFAVEDFPQFLRKVGKGMPSDMKYGLTVPMSIHVTTGEARFQLRDYPLPLLHIPPLANGQSPRLPAMSMKADFVVAEEFRDIESQRSVNVIIVPPEKMADGRKDGFAISVRRSISPVKTYSDMNFEINTSQATRFTWGSSYMPALQDTMQAIEGFTKPPFDPSERVGFWDKVRLSFHSRVNIAWKGDGDVHFIFKGSRDPYVLTGEGAGLVMVWRNDVRWNIAVDPDPRKFMTVDSGDYILAVPDFNSYARHQSDHHEHEDSSSSISSNHRRDAVFKKVVMKLSGNVRWLAGLMFERDLPDGGRSFDFMPHYNVVLKHPEFAKSSSDGEYDAYRGFRSNHIHMSIAVAAPHDRDWSVSNLKSSSNYNSVHLTPRFFSHFFAWWKMFGGGMSLPIRQGPLWGVTQKKSKKFGRHIATIKYNLLLSPLYISHIYKHKDAEDYKEDSVSVTGLKMKLDSFMLDMHQRREYFDIKGHAGAETKRSSAMKINQAQLDFISADLRAISASIVGTTTEDIEKASDETMISLHDQAPSVDISKFTIPDNDFTWIDMDDFVELDWILPAESDPETKILPLGYAPRFTYFRQTEHGDAISGDKSRTSSFGDEHTHFCVMSEKNDPRRIQALLIEKRLKQLNVQIAENNRNMGAQELKHVRAQGGDEDLKNFTMLKEHAELLQHKSSFMQNIYNILVQRLENDDPTAVPGLETNGDVFESHNMCPSATEDAHLDSAPLADYSSDFNNRFIIHNPQIKWNNSLRNIILRYIHQNSQRRGFVYYMSRRAVKFILDILDEQKKNDADAGKREESFATPQTPFSPDADDETMVQDRIEALLRDGRETVTVEEPAGESKGAKSRETGPSDEIATEYTPLNTYHVRLIAPQIQLQSEKNPCSVVLVTAKGLQLKVVQIMDKDRINDDVSGLVQRRFTAAMDSLQMFTTNSKTFSTKNLNLYASNRYGVKPGSHWPPWVPFEVMFDFQTNPYGLNRVVYRTSASLRYDKHNNLRLKYNDDVSGKQNDGSSSNKEDESHLDHIWLEFPHFRCICDSDQYFSLYIMVMDLLLYNEPLEKTRSERLEKIMLASDFSDLTGAPEMVQMLQERIRQLEEIKTHFDVHERFLDRQGWKDRIIIDRDMATCEDELFFMLKAITTAQQRVDDRRDQEHATGILRLHTSASEIVWHLIRGEDESLLEFQLKDASFDRTDYNDGSNYSCGEIGRINGYNLLPDALYPEIIGPFIDSSKGFSELGNNKMLRVQWLMLEAIAGIPVVDHFEIDLVPLKLQLERDVAKKLFEYIFPDAKESDGHNSSPFMIKNRMPEEVEDEDTADKYDNTHDASEVHIVDTDAPHSGSAAAGNGAGSLERRLVPTLHLSARQSEQKRPESRGLGVSGPQRHNRGFSLFHHSDKSRSSVASRSDASRQAPANANLSPMIRSPSDRSLSTMQSDGGSGEVEKDKDKEKDKNKRFTLKRSNSEDAKKKRKKERSDDLTQMMNRASNYMTLAYVKLPSIVLCLSYKGKGNRNIEDVHDLVFRMPTLEYRNKTWSNLDLAMQLKKDVIKALISHAGAIVGNKFSHPKPNRQQQTRLREIANRSTILSREANGAHSETSSIRDRSPGSLAGRPSTATGASSMLRSSVSIRSAADRSSTDIASRPATSDARINGHGTNGRLVHDPMPGQAVTDIKTNGSESLTAISTSRVASLTRRVSGFGQRLRQADTSAPDEAEESKRKSKILLGGQKLFRSLKE